MEPTTSEQSEKRSYETGKLLQIPFEEYKEAEGINSHGLMDILRSPEHYFEHRYRRVTEKETDALRFGKLFHYAVLEPELFRNHFVIEPKVDKRTKVGKEAYEAWEKELKPKAIVVPEKDCDKLLRMCDKMLAHPLTKGVLAKGIREGTIFWTDPETGELCKARPDFISEAGWVVDLKTAMDAREWAFQRDIERYNYNIQVSHYCAAGKDTSLYRHDAFIWLVIEKDPPYGISVYPADESVFGTGDQWRRTAMKIYAKCRKENKWPGYNPNAKSISMPMWAKIPEDFGYEG